MESLNNSLKNSPKNQLKVKFRLRLSMKLISIIAAIVGILLFYINFTLFSGIPQIFMTLNIISIIIIIGIPLSYRYTYFSKIKKVEVIFPRFLRDITENIRIGMTLTQALRALAKIDYDALTPYVKEMNAKISWGITFDNVLLDFSNKMKSESIRRTVQTIIEAYKSGGTIETIFESVTESLQQLERIKKERASSIYSQMVTGYMIYFIFLGVIVGISSFLIPAFQFQQTMPEMENFYSELFRSLVIIQGFFAGLAIGKMAEGQLSAGLKHALVLVIVGFTVVTFLA